MINNNKKILVTIPVEDIHKEKLENAYPEGNFTYMESPESIDLKDINIIVGNVSPALLSAADKLEWLQLSSAGSDEFIKEGVLPKGAMLTNSSGAYGLAISEYLLAGTLALIKRLNQYHVNQTNHIWRDEGNVNSIYNSRTLIVGFGDIGSEFGKRMKALGSYVVGIKKNTANKPAWIDELYDADALDRELSKADIVALALPNTPQTKGIIDYGRLSLMKSNAILLNVGRGSAVVSNDLCKALNENIIFGAYLDVTEPEPLPLEHPLWDAKNIIITPHISGYYHLRETLERVVDIAYKNLKLYKSGKALKNIVNFETGYRRNEL